MVCPKRYDLSSVGQQSVPLFLATDVAMCCKLLKDECEKLTMPKLPV